MHSVQTTEYEVQRSGIEGTQLRQITGSKAYSKIHITSSSIMLATEYIVHTCIHDSVVKVVKPEKRKEGKDKEN